jgi:hypothetical protein
MFALYNGQGMMKLERKRDKQIWSNRLSRSIIQQDSQDLSISMFDVAK